MQVRDTVSSDRRRQRSGLSNRVAAKTAVDQRRTLNHPHFLLHSVLGCILFVAALWVLAGVELRLLLGADAQWSARIQPVAWVLHLHAACGVIALASAPVQFATRVRRAFPRLHRAVGICYVIAVVTASLTALVVAASLCGPAAQLASSAQACLWATMTLVAVRAILTGDAVRHGWWMMRSYALTYTFVLGRLITDVLHLRLPESVGGDAALIWLLTIGAVVAADLLLPAAGSPHEAQAHP